MVGAAAQLPRSVLILDQSDRDSAWHNAFSLVFRSTLNAKSAVRVSVYTEHLDLSRFGGPRHEELMRRYLRDKFSERPIGVMKDCPTGERTIIVQAARNGGSMVEIAVRDRGTGLATDKLDKIFQPFYTTKSEGLGMGLSISRSIVEAHGGTLRAKNNPDRGATFYFTIPVIVEGKGA